MKKTLTAVIATAVVGGIGFAAPAANAEDVTLHEPDMTFCDSPDYGPCAENENNSHELLRNGIHLFAANYNGYTSGTFALDTSLSDVTDASMQWYNEPGNTGEPGIRISGDFDGDDVRDTLYGESAYNGNWWLSSSSSQAVKDAAPQTQNTGGNGSDWYGSLEDWAAEFPDGEVDRGGYILGVPADGILRSLTYAGTTYTFTSDLPRARPIASATITPKVRKANVAVTAKQPKATVPTAKGAYYKVLKVNPRTNWTKQVAAGRIHAGATDKIQVVFPDATKKMQVRVVSYGEVIAQRMVTMG